MYVLLDLEMLSASIEIVYSVQVVLRCLLAVKRNFPVPSVITDHRNMHDLENLVM
jgi:hypothetical protein